MPRGVRVAAPGARSVQKRRHRHEPEVTYQ